MKLTIAINRRAEFITSKHYSFFFYLKTLINLIDHQPSTVSQTLDFKLNLINIIYKSDLTFCEHIKLKFLNSTNSYYEICIHLTVIIIFSLFNNVMMLVFCLPWSINRL